jgi:hypothetical protein
MCCFKFKGKINNPTLDRLLTLADIELFIQETHARPIFSCCENLHSFNKLLIFGKLRLLNIDKESIDMYFVGLSYVHKNEYCHGSSYLADYLS